MKEESEWRERDKGGEGGGEERWELWRGEKGKSEVGEREGRREKRMEGREGENEKGREGKRERMREEGKEGENEEGKRMRDRGKGGKEGENEERKLKGRERGR